MTFAIPTESRTPAVRRSARYPSTSWTLSDCSKSAAKGFIETDGVEHRPGLGSAVTHQDSGP